jgi:uncharacterized protein (DUF1810 family)
MSESYDLERFVAAQATSYDTALAEIRGGLKRSHWMWFIFPQMRGLGHSAMAQHYGIVSIEEARTYLDHPVLGPRLRACVTALGRLEETSATAVFGSVDAAKLRSSLTLFAAAGGGPEFEQALDRWFAGERDPRTLALLG